MNIDWTYPSNKIYVTSHDSMRQYWLDCIESGYEIEASWLKDEPTPALRRLYEAGSARVLLVYYTEGEGPPNHVMYEIGAALTNGRMVVFCDHAGSHELADHPDAVRMDLQTALSAAQDQILEQASDRVEYLETYAHVEYRKDMRPAHPNEADIIAISSHASTKDNAIILPYPNGLDWGRKICAHLDDAMARAFLLGSKKEAA